MDAAAAFLTALPGGFAGFGVFADFFLAIFLAPCQIVERVQRRTAHRLVSRSDSANATCQAVAVFSFGTTVNSGNLRRRLVFPHPQAAEVRVVVAAATTAFGQFLDLVGVAAAEHHVVGEERRP